MEGKAPAGDYRRLISQSPSDNANADSDNFNEFSLNDSMRQPRLSVTNHYNHMRESMSRGITQNHNEIIAKNNQIESTYKKSFTQAKAKNSISDMDRELSREIKKRGNQSFGVS